MLLRENKSFCAQLILYGAYAHFEIVFSADG